VVQSHLFAALQQQQEEINARMRRSAASHHQLLQVRLSRVNWLSAKRNPNGLLKFKRDSLGLKGSGPHSVGVVLRGRLLGSATADLQSQALEAACAAVVAEIQELEASEPLPQMLQCYAGTGPVPDALLHYLTSKPAAGPLAK
jgi:hypothetical protein